MRGESLHPNLDIYCGSYVDLPPLGNVLYLIRGPCHPACAIVRKTPSWLLMVGSHLLLKLRKSLLRLGQSRRVKRNGQDLYFPSRLRHIGGHAVLVQTLEKKRNYKLLKAILSLPTPGFRFLHEIYQ
jgi:hypothetical protein